MTTRPEPTRLPRLTKAQRLWLSVIAEGGAVTMQKHNRSGHALFRAGLIHRAPLGEKFFAVEPTELGLRVVGKASVAALRQSEPRSDGEPE